VSVPGVLREIVEDLAKLHYYPKRLRVAVTAAEYDEIKAHMTGTYGEFYGRILNVPLVIASDAADPVLTVAWA
jgi:hypothetical protein